DVEKPTYLTSLTPFYTDYGSTKLTGVVLQDKLGNSYFDCIEYIGGHFDLKKNNISTFKKRDTYVIGGKYSTFSGTVFVPDTRTSFWDTEISDQDKSKGSFALRIYGDDRLLYQSPVMISTQYPVVFELDVSGVDQLSIAWATFSDVTAEIGLADACLYKD
ncbi:MAG: NPCBM/NEW2 domain-containing protein, partial [Clostridia bacterium]|nr:NPCBM/NEW2 domain-containing protein [Clostridia bacterium]